MDWDEFNELVEQFQPPKTVEEADRLLTVLMPALAHVRNVARLMVNIEKGRDYGLEDDEIMIRSVDQSGVSVHIESDWDSRDRYFRFQKDLDISASNLCATEVELMQAEIDRKEAAKRIEEARIRKENADRLKREAEQREVYDRKEFERLKKKFGGAA